MTGSERACLLRALASSLRSGHTARRSLIEWPTLVPDRAASELLRTSRLAGLGAPLVDCIQAAGPVLGEHVQQLALAFEVHLRTGADLAGLVDRIAGLAARTEQESRGAAAHAAGARLSARMIALLPLATLPLSPGSTEVVTDPRGLLAVVVGLILAAAGSRWIARLLPEPHRRPYSSWVAPLVAAGLRAGASLPSLLCLCAAILDDAGLTRAARRAFLGGSWSEALLASHDEELIALGRVIRRAESLGAPLADQIEVHIEERTAAADADHEGMIRSAPVRMAVPLVLCVLPSFILLGLAPHLSTHL